MAITSLKEDFEAAVEYAEILAMPIGGTTALFAAIGGLIGAGSGAGLLAGAFAGAAFPLAVAGTVALGGYAATKAVQGLKHLAGMG
jgi:DUF917 family protein